MSRIESRAGAPPARRTHLAPRIALVLAGLALAGAGLSGLTSPAGAAGPVTDGSDWGSQGTLSSDSSVTVRWDNTGNAAEDVVPRNGLQTIPHTDGKTYDDIASNVVDSYAKSFDADNGLGGLTVSIAQTRGLVNQAISVNISGAAGGLDPDTQNFSSYFQIFQCWGGLTAAGKPDPNAANPDPATCQVGEHGPDSINVGGYVPSEERRAVNDPLITSGGDWRQYSTAEAPSIPFTAISGAVVNGAKGQNNLFSKDTTNELSHVVPDNNGSATRQFEVQTSLQSSGLGCGRNGNAPSTPTCWLVVVPRIQDVMTDSDGPISPSIWAQRMQVKLHLRDISVGCPGGQARSLIGGSEMLTNAAASWTPGVCAARHIELGYTRLGDEVARGQYADGTNPAILTTQPVASTKPAVVVPVGLAAPVIAYQLIYQPRCRWSPADTEASAHECGYDSLAALHEDSKRAGTLIHDVRLDARLVVKLLTQSYQFAIFDRAGFHRSAAAWMTDRPTNLGTDPEFLRLNPDLRHINLKDAANQALHHVIVESLRSDAAAAVWHWILADDDARAFLNGCPDQDGTTINPFYSTRTYAGCSDQAATLKAKADADRAATPTASAYVDLPLTYPPDGSPYPLPTWQEAVAPETPTYGVVDHLPPVDSMAAGGRDVGIGYAPINTLLCSNTPQAPNDDCGPVPGKWKDPKVRQTASQLGLLAITDAATAARWRVPTAQLCDSDGTHCVGASMTSLEAAANRFTTTDGWASPGDADYGDGAYPLTLPVYAAIDPTLPLPDRLAYAKALEYIASTGQHPGFDDGELPPGYAPMTSAMRNQADAAISELRKPAPVTDPTSSPSPTGDGDGPNGTGPGTGPGSTVVPGNTDPTAVPSGSATTPPTATAQVVAVSAGTETWPSFTIPLGLGLAVVAGLAGPVLRLRGAFKVGR